MNLVSVIGEKKKQWNMKVSPGVSVDHSSDGECIINRGLSSRYSRTHDDMYGSLVIRAVPGREDLKLKPILNIYTYRDPSGEAHVV